MTATLADDAARCFLLVLDTSRAQGAARVSSLDAALERHQRGLEQPVGFSLATVADIAEARTACLTADAPTLALLDAPDQWQAGALIRAGVQGVASWEEPPSGIVHAARAVLAGFVLVPRAVRGALDRPSFTARQKQILGLLVLGLSNREIADRLFLAEVTVKTHLTKIFASLGVQSRSEAISLVLDPATGLGTGILALGPGQRTQVGYGRPSIT